MKAINSVNTQVVLMKIDAPALAYQALPPNQRNAKRNKPGNSCLVARLARLCSMPIAFVVTWNLVASVQAGVNITFSTTGVSAFQVQPPSNCNDWVSVTARSGSLNLEPGIPTVTTINTFGFSVSPSDIWWGTYLFSIDRSMTIGTSTKTIYQGGRVFPGFSRDSAAVYDSSSPTSFSLPQGTVKVTPLGLNTPGYRNGEGGTFNLQARFEFAPAPFIEIQPANQGVVLGGNASFTVVASGDGTLSYQWSFNGIEIPGATYSSYRIDSVSSANVGDYTVRISNAAGSVMSDAATLTIVLPAEIATQPQDQATIEGGSVTFSAGATGSGILGYQWLFNGVAILGANASSYTVSDIKPGHAGYYQVVVTNSYGSDTSLPAYLAVTELPKHQPDLAVEASGIRILNAAGQEIWNPAPGQALTLAVTIANLGSFASADGVVLNLFQDGAPLDLSAYDIGDFNVIGSLTLGAIPAGSSVTVLLPWTAPGSLGVPTLTAVAEYLSNRAQSQANAEDGTTEPLPVEEASLGNGLASRAVRVGVAGIGYGIDVTITSGMQVTAGRPSVISGFAVYGWGARHPVLGAGVTLNIGETQYETRTLSPDGRWTCTINGLEAGRYPVLAHVSDGVLDGETNAELNVTPIPGVSYFTDLQVMEASLGGPGVYRSSGGTFWAVAGGNVTVQTRIRNGGNFAAGAFRVEFKSPDGSVLSRESLAGLAPGAEVWVAASTNWTASPAGLSQLTVLADSDNEVAESSKANNLGAVTAQVRAPKPDLIVAAVTFDNNAPKAGDAVAVTATLRNIGPVTLPAGTAFDVAFRADGSTFATRPVVLGTALPTGGETLATVSWNTGSVPPGMHSISAAADSGLAIDEDYEDNERSATIPVRAALPNLAPWYQSGKHRISGLRVSPLKPVVGDTATLECNVHNLGTVAVPAGTRVAVAFRVNGVLVGTGEVMLSAHLPVLGITTVSIPWNTADQSAGNVSVEAEVDPGSLVIEEIESDNSTAVTALLYAATADLKVSDLRPGNWQPRPGSTVALTATLRNDGGLASPGGETVVFYRGNPDTGGVVIGSVVLGGPVSPLGGTRSASVFWTAPGVAGPVDVYAVLGASRFHQRITVTSSPAPDLAVYSEYITLAPTWPNTGDPVTVSTRLSNRAGSAATDVVVRFFSEASSGEWVELGAPRVIDLLPVGGMADATCATPLIASQPVTLVKVEVSSSRTDAFAGDNAATTSLILGDWPWANAGTDQAAQVGQPITLDGSGSRNAHVWTWRIVSRPVGSTAELSDSHAISPIFAPDVSGNYIIELVVSGSPASEPDQVVIEAKLQGVNAPPVPGPMTLGTQAGKAATLSVAKLIRAAADADGDTITLADVATESANGGMIALATDGSKIIYTPTLEHVGTDSFTYILTDSHGGTAQGTVHVNVSGFSVPQLSVLGVAVEGSRATIRLAGIPGLEYDIEASDTLDGDWEVIGQATAGASGLFEYVDTDVVGHPSRFYRSRQH